ncbi:MAG: hypothetical protein QT08_C0009G0004 [archaeon GW2011_AR17]|nr:MAG: hypothetical protein QT08_C0009G0004 [archaeon GW2011_AR17]MBS3154204.1 hypothetical protein [Candidatus Woesearchaeota archaeon]HIH14758.1 hypothetical protein [Nanoarchaeota archaeon]HIH58690.1 hypothetical protein [Nanoarchaeota archaeon]HII14478.1 hypothetical protein [Nanoarchaeota archaeon]
MENEELKTEKKENTIIHKANWALLTLFTILILFNQYQVLGLNDLTGNAIGSFSFGNGDLSDVDVTEIQSTAQGIALLFPLNDIETTEDAIAIMLPLGTPEYGNAMGVSFDDPVNSLSLLENGYPTLKTQAEANPEVWERYIALAAAPRGISCEFCCGIGAQGVTTSGELRCGCAHNPAAQAVALWLMLNTDYSDAEVLREVYRWKTLWFPKDMVGLALDIAGGNTDVLNELPGMVGGC